MPATDDEASPPRALNAEQETRKTPDEITLVSAEGERFTLAYAAAQLSPPIRAGMAEEGFLEARNGEMHFGEIRAPVLKKVVEYLEWHAKFKDAKHEADVPEFHKNIEPEIALELLMAADFLEV